MPAGHDFYTAFSLDGHFVAGMIDQQGGAPAAWLSYGELFGWRTEFVGMDESEYWGLYNGENMNGG